MKTFYFTITGTNHYYGTEFLNTGMKVKLIKTTKKERHKDDITVPLGRLGTISSSENYN